MNNAVLVGRITRDLELKYTPGAGTAVVSFTLAVNKRFKRDGEPDADFISVVVYGKSAENLAQYQGKGSLIGVVGRIQTRSYDGKDGKKVYITEVVANDVSFLGNKGDSKPKADFQDVSPEHLDDVPF